MPAVTSKERLDAQLKVCALHRKRIQWALGKLKPSLPLTPDSYRNLDDAQVEHWDQLIWRFTKLQDLMGEKVFHSLLSTLQEPVVTSPFIDQLARLEQLGVLDHAEDWQELRQARNSSAHEYAESPEEGAELLNAIVDLVNGLLQILDRVASMRR